MAELCVALGAEVYTTTDSEGLASRTLRDWRRALGCPKGLQKSELWQSAFHDEQAPGEGWAVLILASSRGKRLQGS